MKNELYFLKQNEKIEFHTVKFNTLNIDICRNLNFVSANVPFEYAETKKSGNFDVIVVKEPPCVFDATYSIASACIFLCEFINQYAEKTIATSTSIYVTWTMANVKSMVHQLFELTKLLNASGEVFE